MVTVGLTAPACMTVHVFTAVVDIKTQEELLRTTQLVYSCQAGKMVSASGTAALMMVCAK